LLGRFFGNIQLVGVPRGVSLLAWERLGIPQGGVRDIWVSFLDLLPPQPNLNKQEKKGRMDGWIEESRTLTTQSVLRNLFG